MFILPLKLALFHFLSIPATFTAYAAPVLKFIFEFAFLTLHISRMMLSVSFLWLWEIAANTEFVDAFAIILSVVISTSVLLEMFQYEIVFTFNSESTEYEQHLDLN
ncbi:unnamed protein product [Caenorhabditis nigoni]